MLLKHIHGSPVVVHRIKRDAIRVYSSLKTTPDENKTLTESFKDVTLRGVPRSQSPSKNSTSRKKNIAGLEETQNSDQKSL